MATPFKLILRHPSISLRAGFEAAPFHNAMHFMQMVLCGLARLNFNPDS
jgi:hypothetical protein